LNKIEILEDEVECLTGVISVMKEDLQVLKSSVPFLTSYLKVKDEQFDYLYASIKARNEQYFEYKKAEDEQLRARLHQLDLENDQLQVAFLLHSSLSLVFIAAQNQLRRATRKLDLLTWKTASKNSPFSNMPDDLMTYIISYLSPVELVSTVSTT
jgi:exonuclease VII large subunit